MNVQKTIPTNKNQIKEPREYDILAGRGGLGNNHLGNRRYHALISAKAIEYGKLKKRNEKTSMAWSVVAQLKREGVRLLKRDKITGLFSEESDEDFRKKVSQRLRERALELSEYCSFDSDGEEMVGSIQERLFPNTLTAEAKASVTDYQATTLEASSPPSPSIFDPDVFIDKDWYTNAGNDAKIAASQMPLEKFSLHSDESGCLSGEEFLSSYESDQAVCEGVAQLLEDAHECSFSSLADDPIPPPVIHIDWNETLYVLDAHEALIA